MERGKRMSLDVTFDPHEPTGAVSDLGGPTVARASVTTPLPPCTCDGVSGGSVVLFLTLWININEQEVDRTGSLPHFIMPTS